MAACGGGTGLERAGFPPRPVHLKLVVAGARSVPERSGCDGETGADDFMRLARFAVAADGDRPRAANNTEMDRRGCGFILRA